ncbi:type 2 periplasmic-binding domain-containing protein [Cohnella fermenti]|uniref:Extracellular solute-binding protein n=1 Tax=Cohnella fermenti TaxID=2565925 RepID=A0A4S4BS13_9BACL|nr:extracellular solute-binding protein [Cohnella fermenti]THF77793.1 extracellular solute-binding protein [Cohnella fermenti]
MKLNRTFVSVLVGVMAVVAVSACSNDSSNEKNASPSGSASQAGSPASSAASAAGPIELTSVKMLDPNVTFADGEDIENNIWTRAAKDEYGVTITYKWTAPSAQYSEKVALMLATGDLPDFLQLDATGYEQALKAGLLADLTDAYEKYASPALKERMMLDGGDALQAGMKDGKMYAVVQANSWKTDSEQMLYIRKDWLDKLNLEAPKTIDDVMRIAEAFTKQDPDGNNADDTIGLGMTLNNYFGFLNGNNAYRSIWMPDGSGNLVYSSIQPEMRDALLKLQQMYKNGYIDPEFYTKGMDVVKTDITNGKIGMIYDNYVAPLNLMDSWDKDKNADWIVVPQPALTEAEYPAKSEVKNGFSYYLVASKNIKNPEAFINMINLFVDKQSNDSSYVTDSEGRMVHNYAPANISTPDGNLYNQRLIAKAIESGDPEGLLTGSNTAQAKQNYENVIRLQEGSTDKTDWGLGKIFGPESSLSVLDQYYFTPAHYVKNEFYGAPTPAMVKYSATLNDLEDQTFTKIITGTSIDSFDKFVDNWHSLGGDEITKEVNAFYQSR